MLPRPDPFAFFERHREYGALALRLAIGYRLIYGTADNVFSYAHMVEFAEFLAARGVPAPLFSAFVSAYAQFICGILFILGAATRYAAVVMIVNFIAALIIAHRGLPYLQNVEPIAILAASLLLLFQGPGRPSVDSWWNRRRK
ncbi:MAG: DoxX family protein [Gemmatimonadales bacterium]|nr:DoxX family protein [Gemmatimonadales bacterium]MDQ3426590.1 DoxX family protein [Gemmatimonadota bacterium]